MNARKLLFPFHGGLKTVRHKAESNQSPIQPGVLPRRLTVPLRQHIGAIAKPLVQPGDRVLKGQMIGQADISAPLSMPRLPGLSPPWNPGMFPIPPGCRTCAW